MYRIATVFELASVCPPPQGLSGAPDKRRFKPIIRLYRSGEKGEKGDKNRKNYFHFYYFYLVETLYFIKVKSEE